ncbi:Mut7-C ubiquitin/RNAse domain-containing protein [Segetibacter aerophilus]|uniref:Twitching motility protein PilT n=1 Tax=Segetibacter aerophilus TaxID=670293 RepID=A0A512B9I5_9BACT|nr:Mut7-C ubiquitin/RNAse domain-containing protein [Segetibacter aerophilus]GEO08626.1 hypothetical protein SAE01_11220 [Segetibacter aerophilus]
MISFHLLVNSNIEYWFNGSPSIKDAIEANGIPHTEVNEIIVNGAPVDFSYTLRRNDRADVFPVVNIASLSTDSVIPPLPNPVSFIADVHLGKLARELRMLGIDTFYENNWNDQQVADIAQRENCVVLTRDIGLLKHKKIKWGYWLRSQLIQEQLSEVIGRYNLAESIHPFKRCIDCNGIIEPVEKENILLQLPPKTKEYFNEFYQCKGCGKVYWKGSHYENMLKKIKTYYTD